MKKIIVRLKGGLGNQMFQYAAGRSLALKNGMELVLDIRSGFIFDNVYQRNYSLNCFSLGAAHAKLRQMAPFVYERILDKICLSLGNMFRQRPWGLYIYEREPRYFREINDVDFQHDIYMDGYWQTERYFLEHKQMICIELMPPVPCKDRILKMCKIIEKNNSVAVGVRLFEEMPVGDRHLVGGMAPLSFYEEAAAQMADKIKNPVFFVFCTNSDAIKSSLNLRGTIYYLTDDEGYENAMDSLWLMSMCRHHILSNSSFYWWGAYLAEQRYNNSIVISCDQFANVDCIPDRWASISTKPADSENVIINF